MKQEEVIRMTDDEAIKILKSLINIVYGAKGKDSIFSDVEVVNALQIGISAIEERNKNANN